VIGRLLACALLAAAALGCDRGASRLSAEIPGGRRLVTATLSDPKTFNPVLVTDAASSGALSPLFEGLVKTNPKTTRIEPELAESWEWSEDGKVCTFKLRRDVRWHDGKPLTAADVAFTFDAIYDDRVPNSSRFSLSVDGQRIATEVVDEQTIRFHLPRPFAPFLSAVGVPIIPEHILGEALAQGTFTHTWGIDTPPEQLVGTGPYRMRRYAAAQLIEYDRNPDYWMRDAEGRRLPYLEGQVVLIVPEQNAISLKFLAGQTYYYNPRPEEVADLQDRATELGITVAEVGSDTGDLFLSLNRNPRHYALPGTDSAAPDGPHDPRLDWFTDRRFLRALAHAVDKRGMVDTIFYGFGEPAVSFISPENKLFYNPDLKDYEYDLALAGHLLDEAGYRDRDGDGWREDERGNRIEFGLITNAGNALRERMCSILRDDFEKLGIKINYRPLTFTALVERLNVNFDWDAVLIGFTGTIEPNNGANFLRSSGNLHLWNPAQKTPATPWEAEIDRLLDAGSAELDVEKRRVIYWRIQEILHDELPFIETVRQRVATAYRNTLLNFHPTVWGICESERIDIAAR
jgi:peptide/nickel transport system substrate-binding protein